MKLKDILRQTKNQEPRAPRIPKSEKSPSGLPPYLDKKAYEDKKKETIRKMRERVKEKKRERREREKAREKERKRAEQLMAVRTIAKDHPGI